MSWLGKLDGLTDAQVRQVAYLLADCAERSEPATEARMDRWVARFGPAGAEPCDAPGCLELNGEYECWRCVPDDHQSGDPS